MVYRGYQVEMSFLQSEDARAVELHKQRLLSCDAVMLYYGGVDRNWLEYNLWYLDNVAGLRKVAGDSTPGARRLRVKGVYVAAPETEHKRGFNAEGFIVIKNYGEFAWDSLDEFFALIEE